MKAEKFFSMKNGSLFISAGMLSAGECLTLEENHIINEKVLSFSFNVKSDSEKLFLRLGHGESVYGGSYIELTSTDIRIFNYTTEPTLVKEEKHGLTLCDTVNVVITTHLYTADVTVCASGAIYQLKGVLWSGRQGEIFARSISSEIYEAKMRWYCTAYEYDVWVLGDSYLNSGAKTRWPYYLRINGYEKYLLMGYPGRNSASGLCDFKKAIKYGVPKYAVWCLGMNDSDDESEMNVNYKKSVEEFLQICTEQGITPILSTIPCTPKVRNNHKNAFVKNSGYRFIDFASAVGGVAAFSPWGEGMLSTDLVHPAEAGARALYTQFIVDFLEILKY